MTARSTLAHATAAGRDAAALGFDWETAAEALDKVTEEVAELREAIAANDLDHCFEELGDLLFAVGNVARKLDLDADAALAGATEKFERRFKDVLRRVAAAGAQPEDLSLDELEAHWQAAKAAEPSRPSGEGGQA